MKPEATLLVDFTRFGFPPQWEWYTPLRLMIPGEPFDCSIERWEVPHYGAEWEPQPTPIVERFLQSVDVVFSAETFYDYWLIKRARELGVRTVLQPNYEFLEYLIRPDLPRPDVFALPTPWHRFEIERALPGETIIDLPVPVDLDVLPYRRRESLNTVLHVAGNVAQTDRAGTRVVVEAMRLLYRDYSDVRCVIRAQRPLDPHRELTPPIGEIPRNTTVIVDQLDNYGDLYDDGDLLVLPRRFGGLCLPAQEAMGCGMPVLMPNVDPNHYLLPSSMLLPATAIETLQTRALLDLWDVDPADVADRIVSLRGRPTVYAEACEWAEDWRADHSWDALRPRYMEVLGA
jgi:glycosyltransferase involved in cell wall biosynthesis